MTTASDSATRHGYLRGLDYGRAFFAVAVVAFHAQALGPFDALSRPARPDLAGVIYLNVLLIAVPFFFTTSLFLYARSWRPDLTRFRGRLVQLGLLSAFWISLTWSFRGVGQLEAGEAPAFILSGGDSAFYFFVGLIWLTVTVELMMRRRWDARPRLLIALTLASALVMLLEGPLADALPGDRYVVNYWSPLNFIAYAPAAILLVRFEAKVLSGRVLVLALSAYVGLAVVEWMVLDTRDVGPFPVYLPVYSRPSLVLAAALIVAVLVRGAWHPPRVVVWLSGLSLGIYCVHQLVLENAAAIWPALYDKLDVSPFLIFAAVLATSIALVAAARSRRLM